MSLDDIRAREQAATEGPWAAEDHLYADRNGRLRITSSRDSAYANLAESVAPWDADFIAHARTDIPKLLAALDAIHERLERLEKVAEGHVQDPDGYTSGIGQGLRIAAASVGLAIDEALR